MTKLRIHRLNKEIQLPRYALQGDAGFDLRSAENKIIPPGEQRLIKTGIRIAIPENHTGLVWDRSGLAANHQITTLGGVFDTGFRGEVMVIMKNLGNTEFKIEKNDRIAQMIIQPYIKTEIEEVEELDKTKRNESGLGSTGVT